MAVADQRGVYAKIRGILHFHTDAEITALLNKINVSGQKADMAQRNRYIRGENTIPLYPLLDVFQKIPKVAFEGRSIRNVDYPLSILSDRRDINYRYIGGGTYGEIYRSADNVMKQIKFKIKPEDGQNAITMTVPNTRRRNIDPILPIQIENERASREFFIELIIQVILHSDPEVGRYIPRVNNVYVNSKALFAQRETRSTSHAALPAAPAASVVSRRTTLAAERAAAAAAEAAAREAADKARHALVRQALAATEGNIAYITMDFVDYTFESYCIHLTNIHRRELNVLDIAPIFRQLGYLLEQLKIKYNFRHGDLHCGNVMINAASEIRLIDFGMSCIQYQSNVYKAMFDADRYLLNDEQRQIAAAAATGRRAPIARIGGCDSYDLLIFLTAFIEHWFVDNEYPRRYKFSDDAQAYFRSLMNFTFNGRNHNLYNLLEGKHNPREGGSVFHLTYPSQLDTVKFPIGVDGAEVKLRDICELISHIKSPVEFGNIFNALIAAGAAAGAAGAPAGAVAAAARGGVPTAPGRGLIRRCLGGICTWISRQFGVTRKAKNTRRARHTRRRFRRNRRY